MAVGAQAYGESPPPCGCPPSNNTSNNPACGIAVYNARRREANKRPMVADPCGREFYLGDGSQDIERMRHASRSNGTQG